MSLRELREAALHKPYECAGCHGGGTVWDRCSENMELCPRCDGDGRVDAPVDPVFIPRRGSARRYSGPVPFFRKVGI